MAENRSTPWPAVAAVGTLLTGVAAVAALVFAVDNRSVEADPGTQPALAVAAEASGKVDASTAAQIPSYDPSFDCTQAKSAPELAICNNPHLARADHELGRAFSSRMAAAKGEKDAILAEQRNWILRRDETCQADVDCLFRSIVDRTVALRKAR